MIEIMAVCLLGIMLSLGVLLAAVSKVSKIEVVTLFLQNNDTIMHFTVEQYSDHVDNQLYVYYAFVSVELGARFFIETQPSSDHCSTIYQT